MDNNKQKRVLQIRGLAAAMPLLVILLAFTNISGNHLSYNLSAIDTPLTESQKHLAKNGLKELDVAPGLRVETMATEPMLINPTNIDVDEKGRVWVTEAYNYRFEINQNKPREAGDRIVILEDKDGDGSLETSTVFYQGPEVNAPLGVCVLGNRVLISQSPYVWAFYDDNNDGKADRKEILFQGISGIQHDHGMHSFAFGPDGKLYFNFGNAGKTLRDKNNEVVLDQDGDEIGPKKYKEGMLFRCDPDGTHVECLGHNFRNEYESAVDSYGNIWQSDNDDDGNKGVRINYVMEYGNYGYTDEMTGASWTTKRINIEDSIPLRHWHQNDPGVIPNLLQTGSGSPSGMAFYEGTLLPRQFQNSMIHAEPGHNVVRSYPVQKAGAGYTAGILNMLDGERDQWFRPVDVCTAPDGSLIVADWYDPGVGGHRVGDLQRGRIYRVVPKGMKATYKIPEQDFTTPKGAIIALQNPNLAVRRHAFIALSSMGDAGVAELEKLWTTSTSSRMRARALWVLSKSAKATKYLSEAIGDSDPDLRITGLRAAREVNTDVLKLAKALVNDPDAQVRRDCAIALRHRKEAEAATIWAALAAKHDGKDKWYLEALGIGADKQWDQFFAAYLKVVPDPLLIAGGRDIIWRARTNTALPYLVKLASDANVPLKSRLRYLRAFDFYTEADRSKALVKLLEENNGKDLKLSAIVLKSLNPQDISGSPVSQEQLKQVLNSYTGTQDFVDMVKQYNITTEADKLMDLVTANGIQSNGGYQSGGIGADAARVLLKANEDLRFLNVIKGKDQQKASNVLAVLGVIGNDESTAIMSKVVLSNQYSMPIRQKAAQMLGKSQNGEDRVLEMLQGKKLPQSLITPAVAGLSGTLRKSTLDKAKAFLPNTNVAKIAKTKMPSANLNAILALKGNVLKGKAVFLRTCSVCHRVNKDGFEFGPNLSEIGAKLPKEGLFDAIINPSAGINFGYETSQLTMKDGSTLVGIISSRTETDIELKYPGGSVQKIKTNDVKQIKKVSTSMMPAGLAQTMSKQEFADLLTFLASLKKKG
ncbi:PVC-type heme-binding CxxCH protein [Mucilaginibacter sp. NFX135]|uniref:PVC-type heme-binding CxxCH protein n=1 Tax=Mucilaginibacter sp. NFX135 TaxID=3402687 RepID=UPI003AFB77A0